MLSRTRFWLLVTVMAAPSLVLIVQQWSLGPRLGALDTHEREQAVRRVVDEFVREALSAYRDQAREVCRRLIRPLETDTPSRGRMPHAFAQLPSVAADIGRPVFVFVAYPQEKDDGLLAGDPTQQSTEPVTWRIEYFGLDDHDNVLGFSEPTLEPLHQAVLTFLDALDDRPEFHKLIAEQGYYASSEHWPFATLHFFHVPIYLSDNQSPGLYAGFAEPAEMAIAHAVQPMLDDGTLTDQLVAAGLARDSFHISLTATDSTVLPDDDGSSSDHQLICRTRFRSFDPLFEDVVLRVFVLKQRVAGVEEKAQRQNILLLTLAVAWLLVAAVLLVRSARRQRYVAQMHRDFAGRVSHELKTPVAVIANAVESMTNPKLQSEEDQARFLSILKERIRGLAALLDRTIDVCRLDIEGVAVALKPVDLSAVVCDMVPAICTSIGLDESSVTLQADEVVMAQVDVDALHLILRNLLDNVAKHAGDTHSIEIICRPGRRCVQLLVRDHGRGLDTQDRKRIFDRFYQSLDIRNGAQKGYGLGLSLVKSLAEAHGGRVHVEETPGGGCTFCCTLPKAGASS